MSTADEPPVDPADITPAPEIIEPIILTPLAELDDSDVIAPDDYAPAPEFSDFDVWCDFAEDWAAAWRPSPEGQWFCRNCGATDHRTRDHESDGA